jgi:hypothetical protein
MINDNGSTKKQDDNITMPLCGFVSGGVRSPGKPEFFAEQKMRAPIIHYSLLTGNS